ncbi:MAG: znuC [Ignavibacteria bacterium]|nr:znuC [Ignavibacteria bacterium]
MDNNSLIFDSIFFSYGINEILRGTYLNIKKGKIVGLFGMNGCGKSTLLKIGIGALKQNEGLIIINGNRFTSKCTNKKYDFIAYLHQENFLPMDLTIKQLINNIKDNEVKEKLLKNEIISSNLNKKIGVLSGGENRFFEITLVLALNREYIFLDEPFTGLSPLNIEKVVEMIKFESNNGKGIIVCDHYINYSIPLADIKYMLHQGQCKVFS